MPAQRIDVHTHAMSNEAVAAVVGRGFQPTGGYRISVRWTPEAALAYMDRLEIAAQIVSMPMSFAGSDDNPGFGTGVSRMVNEGHAELIAAHPDRFGAFATLPADGPDEALGELTYALDELRLDGVVMTSNVEGRYFGDPSLEPVLAELERREVPVFVHPVDCPHIDVLRFGRPSSIVEFPSIPRAPSQRPLHRCIPAVSEIASDPGALRRSAAHTRMADRPTHRHGTGAAQRGHRSRARRGGTARALHGAGRQPQLAAAHARGDHRGPRPLRSRLAGGPGGHTYATSATSPALTASPMTNCEAWSVTTR
jgi:hypothetical protein